MVVYMVLFSSGSYDSYQEWCGGIFSTEGKALRRIEEEKSWVKDIKDASPEGDLKDDTFVHYLINHEREMEFNGGKVMKFIIDQKVK